MPYRIWKHLRIFEHADRNRRNKHWIRFWNMPTQRDSGYGIDLPRINVKGDPGGSVTGALAPNSVDFCLSNAVLEHVPKRDFALVATELLRVLNHNGIYVYRVDLKNHLGGTLNSLRFSDAAWEGKLFRSSGFYTNRICFGEMLDLFERAGFECHLPRVIRWETLPTPRAKLNASFRQLPDEDLLVSDSDVVLQRKG